MFDYILTSLLLLVLVSSVAWKAKVYPNGNPFLLDKENTSAMRGFWCIIVILVHIPTAFQNRIQDMAGSFAYIGVTFFFLVSAFGLTASYKNNPGGIRHFWRKRLPALFLPVIISRIFVAIVLFLFFDEKIDLGVIFYLNGWLRWLLVCYLIFWASHLLFKNSNLQEIVQDVAIILMSLSMYILQKKNIVVDTIWPTEIWGFIWGSLLARYLPAFIRSTSQHWIKKCILACCSALILGLLYLKFKPIVFWGDYLLKVILGFAITAFILHLNTRIAISNKISGFLGSISYEVYLIHGNVISILGKLFPQAPSGMFIIVVVFSSIFSAYIVHVCASFILRRLSKIKLF